MKTLWVLLGVIFLATSVFATIAPDPDLLGVYFDGAVADHVSVDYNGSPVTASVVITQPSHSVIDGVEFGFLHNAGGHEASMFVVPRPHIGIDVGVKNDANTAGDVIISFTEPVVVAAGQNVVVYHWQIVLFDYFVVHTYLTSTSVSGAATPRYLINGDEFVTLGSLFGSPDIPVGYINECVLAVEESSFGSVKNLFR